MENTKIVEKVLNRQQTKDDVLFHTKDIYWFCAYSYVPFRYGQRLDEVKIVPIVFNGKNTRFKDVLTDSVYGLKMSKNRIIDFSALKSSLNMKSVTSYTLSDCEEFPQVFGEYLSPQTLFAFSNSEKNSELSKREIKCIVKEAVDGFKNYEYDINKEQDKVSTKVFIPQKEETSSKEKASRRAESLNF